MNKKEMNTKIKAMMVLQGVKQADICRELNVKPSTVSLIVSGKKKSSRVRKAIAVALGKRVEDLWPERPRIKAA